MRIIGRKRPDGTAIPKVMSPRMQYRTKKIVRVKIWNSEEVLVEKMLRTASSVVVRRRVARSLYCPVGQLNCLKFPAPPFVGQEVS